MAEAFSASRASRFLQCHASANLELAIPDWAPPVQDPDKDNAANRGTHMHDLFAHVMELPAKDIGNFSRALMYVADIRSTRRFQKLIEEPVIAEWLPSKPGTTADLVLYLSDELHVFDLKTGKIPVSAVDNKQLMFYGVSYGHLAPKAKGVHMHIIQPWAGVMEGWFADTATLAQFMSDAIAADKAITAGSTQFSPGDDCMFCPANPHGRGLKGKPLCPTMMDLLYPRLIDEAEILGG
jgi:hypothetical protein